MSAGWHGVGRQPSGSLASRGVRRSEIDCSATHQDTRDDGDGDGDGDVNRGLRLGGAVLAADIT